MNITVFLADDHAVVRDGLRSLLEAQGDIKVVGEAATGEETLRRLKVLSASVVIDVAIVDIAMPEPNGIEVTRLISKVDRASRVHCRAGQGARVVRVSVNSGSKARTPPQSRQGAKKHKEMILLRVLCDFVPLW